MLRWETPLFPSSDGQTCNTSLKILSMHVYWVTFYLARRGLRPNGTMLSG